MKGFILNADDYGMALPVNDAIEKLAVSGCISSTSIMPNMPYANLIANLIHGKPDIGVGVHLTLTQGKPVSPIREVPSLVNENGEFLTYSHLIKKSLTGCISLKQCKLELGRQIERAKELTNDNIDHWNSHQGIHRLDPLFSIFLNVCKEMAIPSMRIHKHYWVDFPDGRLSPYRPHGNLRSYFIETYYTWLRRRAGKYFHIPQGILVLDELSEFVELLNDKKNWQGVFEIVCHPATNTSGLEQTTLLEKRVKEYEALTKPEIKNILAYGKELNLLKTFRDL